MFVIRRVVGDSMSPTLRPGQTILGIRQPRVLSRWPGFLLRPGRIAIVLHDGLEKIKRIEKLEDNRLYVLGDNPVVSTDSRNFGWLTTEEVLAVVIWPLQIGRRG